MRILESFNKFHIDVGDKVLIHYWYDGMICPVEIKEKKGRKYLISHNIEESLIQNAPDEWIKKQDMIDKYGLEALLQMGVNSFKDILKQGQLKTILFSTLFSSFGFIAVHSYMSKIIEISTDSKYRSEEISHQVRYLSR